MLQENILFLQQIKITNLKKNVSQQYWANNVTSSREKLYSKGIIL